MRFIFAVLCIGFGLFSCAPKVNSSGVTNDTAVDSSSYNGLVQSKWCLPTTNTFYINWQFLSGGSAVMAETDVQSKKDIITFQKTWILRGKTLMVFEKSGAETLQENVSFATNLQNGTIQMVWTDPNDATKAPPVFDGV